MDIYDVGTVQHYSMWWTCKTYHNCNMKKNKYRTVMQFILCVVFDSIKTMNWKASVCDANPDPDSWVRIRQKKHIKQETQKDSGSGRSPDPRIIPN